MKIVADDKIPFLKGVLEPFAEVVYLPGDQINSPVVVDADALLTRSITTCNAGLLAGSKIKLIATATIGDDHIDKQFCAENNIQWTHAKGCNAGAVEQYVTAALLEMAYQENITLKDKMIGIIGVGEIGSRVAHIAGVLGMKVLLNDPPKSRIEGAKGFCNLEEIQQKADFITLHVPLTFEGEDKTFHLLDDDFFERMEKPVRLINSSRGGILETDVLKRSIKSGKIKSLAIDVWENEPEIDKALLELVDISTPHIAGYSLQGKANATEMVVRSLADFFNLPLTSWNPDIPLSEEKININCQKTSARAVLKKIFDRVYPIRDDSGKLKQEPARFEQIRRDYPLRLENESYTVSFSGCSPEMQDVIKKLRFNITN